MIFSKMVVVTIAIIPIALIWYHAGYKSAIYDFKQDAIRHHAAQWVAGPDGSAQFKWNDEISKP